MASAYSSTVSLTLIALALGVSLFSGIGKNRTSDAENLSALSPAEYSEVELGITTSEISSSGLLDSPAGAMVLLVSPEDLSTSVPILELFAEKAVFGLAVQSCGLSKDQLGLVRSIDNRFPRIAKFLNCRDGELGLLSVETGQMLQGMAPIRAADAVGALEPRACELFSVTETLASASAALVRPAQIRSSSCDLAFGDVLSQAGDDAGKKGRLLRYRHELTQAWRAGAAASPAFMRAISAAVESPGNANNSVSRL